MKIPEADQVEVVKIQLTDVSRIWGLAEEERLEPPITWKEFTDSFNERFFPKTAKREMPEQFMKLKQWDKSDNEYAAKFLR